MNIPISRPKRIITFGCSFTNFTWPTYADILAYDLNVPLYNFGCSAAGNEYIANVILQYDQVFGFTENDLVIVQWTSLLREDRFFPEFGKGGQWILKGNLDKNHKDFYFKEFVDKYVSVSNSMLKQFPLMLAVHKLLNHKTNPIFLKMNNIQECPNNFEKHVCQKILKIYKPLFFDIKTSFYSILWGGDCSKAKMNNLSQFFGKHFSENHPSLNEHLTYFESVASYTFSDHTRKKVAENEEKLIRLISEDIKSEGRKVQTAMNLCSSTEHLYLSSNKANIDPKYNILLVL